jgi:hypothetical protein
LRKIERNRPKEILLHANWHRFVERNTSIGLETTIRAIHNASPTSAIFIIGGVPQWSKPLPEVMLKEGLGLDRITHVRTPMLAELRVVDHGLRLSALSNKAFFLSALEHSCTAETCQSVYGGYGKMEPTAWDYGHLTKSGSAGLAEMLRIEIGMRRKK